jgi:hypothetical protein
MLIRYTRRMSHQEDRTPLLLKVALRQALRRMQDEAEAFSQYEALAGNLGWVAVADKAAAVRESLAEAVERAADAVEATVEIQAETAHAHLHEHGHHHVHSHPHDHPPGED